MGTGYCIEDHIAEGETRCISQHQEHRIMIRHLRSSCLEHPHREISPYHQSMPLELFLEIRQEYACAGADVQDLIPPAQTSFCRQKISEPRAPIRGMEGNEAIIDVGKIVVIYPSKPFHYEVRGQLSVDRYPATYSRIPDLKSPDRQGTNDYPQLLIRSDTVPTALRYLRYIPVEGLEQSDYGPATAPLPRVHQAAARNS